MFIFWLKEEDRSEGGKEGEEATVQNCSCPSQSEQSLVYVCVLARVSMHARTLVDLVCTHSTTQAMDMPFHGCYLEVRIQG